MKTPEEVSEIARLKAELKKTKEKLCDEMLKTRLESSFLKLACDELNVSSWGVGHHRVAQNSA